MKTLHLAAGALATIAALGAARVARAQTTEVATPRAPIAPASEQTRYLGPNLVLVTTGLATFGFAYLPSVIVASESSQPADRHLYVPVVGPWLDLGNRPACGAGSIACNTETANKVLLIGNGVLQSLGIVTTVVGLFIPQPATAVTTTATAKNDKPGVHVTATGFGNGLYGVTAFGKF